MTEMQVEYLKKIMMQRYNNAIKSRPVTLN